MFKKQNPISKKIDEFIVEAQEYIDPIECFNWANRVCLYLKSQESKLRKYETYLITIKTFSSLRPKEIGTRLSISQAIDNKKLIMQILKDLKYVMGQEYIEKFYIDLHPMVKKVSLDLFNDGHYSEAIFEAVKALIKFVIKKSKLIEKDSFNLIGKIFNEKNPIIKLNELKTDSDKDEQRGFRFLYQGAVMGIRNPKAHDTIRLNDPNRALKYLAFISLLFLRADEGKL